MRTAAGWAVTFASLGASGAVTRSRAAKERIIGAAPWEAETWAQAGRNVQVNGRGGDCQADFGDGRRSVASVEQLADNDPVVPPKRSVFAAWTAHWKPGINRTRYC